MTAPPLRFVFKANIKVGQPVELGASYGAVERMIPITSGIFSGPDLRGAVLPGGADWQHMRPDGVLEIFARYVMKTSDGALISVTNSGLRDGPEPVMRRLSAGEAVDPSEYYFRTTPAFRTAAPQYQWLMRRVYVATGERKPDEVILNVWEV